MQTASFRIVLREFLRKKEKPLRVLAKANNLICVT